MWARSRLAFVAAASIGFHQQTAGAQVSAFTADRAPGEYDCVLKPSKEVHLSSPVTGVIEEVLVDRGDIVHRGDVIARLRSEVEQANTALAQRKSESIAKIAARMAKIEFLTRKRDRSKVLNVSKIVADNTLDEAETDLALAKQDLAEAQFDQGVDKLEYERALAVLEQRTIRSPIDGVVTERKLSPGEFWTEQLQAVTIAALDTLDVETFVPIALHGRLAVGDFGSIRPEPPIEGTYRAQIDVIDRVYDAASGTFGVRLKLPNPQLSIPAGVRCRIRFDKSVPDVSALDSAGHPQPAAAGAQP